jgi:hypothetical protein
MFRGGWPGRKVRPITGEPPRDIIGAGLANEPVREPPPPAAPEPEREVCGHCGAPHPLFPIEGVPTCYACLTARFVAADRDRGWLLGEQLRPIEQLALSGEPLPGDTALALISDVRRLRKCIFEIQERILALDETPERWSEVRELGPLVATILSLTADVDPHR